MGGGVNLWSDRHHLKVLWNGLGGGGGGEVCVCSVFSGPGCVGKRLRCV